MAMETSIIQEPWDPTGISTSKLVLSPGCQTWIQRDLHRSLAVSCTVCSEQGVDSSAQGWISCYTSVYSPDQLLLQKGWCLLQVL